MDTRLNRRRIAIAVGGAVAICSAGAAIAVADSSPADQSPPAVRSSWVGQSEVAAWAGANGLSGLSPAGLAPPAVRSVSVDQSAVAAWARANGLVGLSPTSLDRVDD